MVEEVAPETLHERLEAGEPVQVLDIRSAPAFRRGHIPGAINIRFDRLPQEVDRYDWGEFIVVVCPHGESSLQAARLLEAYEAVSEDATVANLTGGYDEWSYPLEEGPTTADANRHSG